MSIEQRWVDINEARKNPVGIGPHSPHLEEKIVDPVSGVKRTIQRYPVGLEIITDFPPSGFHPNVGSRSLYRAYDLSVSPPTVCDEKISLFGDFCVHFFGPPLFNSGINLEEEFGDENSVEALVWGEDCHMCSSYYTRGTGEINRIRISADNYDHPAFGNPYNEVIFRKDGDLFLIDRISTHQSVLTARILPPNQLIEVRFSSRKLDMMIHSGFLVRPSIPYQQVYELASDSGFVGWEKVFDVLRDTVQIINDAIITFRAIVKGDLP